ncbi:hypothetical protein SAMN04489760_10346 [Syntrophus gentianae]|uniref:CopG family transcriptional regulator n=1 Tax=Syntrophus gentianae TaxID=43775 RepID=A0A1H7V6R8_9BACT|nr:ribbon-helix-helix domain-containing protein [Syntrophus gentianae]SEM04598.1 hypothetical protein SAMN04489760_10346 [Syntrophus gentianae]
MKKKEGIITFKVNEDLLEIIKSIPNRSEFIRAAIMTALENVCPLCSGTGMLTPKQKEHWDIFAEHHAVKKCEDCQELFIECTRVENK